jgi:hypothetical protein
MALAIVVEDGTIVSGANSYISVANASTYLGTWYPGSAWDAAVAANDGTAEAALYAAAFAMDRVYGRRYLSTLPPASKQTMLWPRYTFMDNTYRLLSNGAIPQCVKDAQCELAMMYLNGVDLFPNESDNRLFKNLALDVGVKINKTYWAKPTDVERYDGFRKVELILWPVIQSEDNSGARLSL